MDKYISVCEVPHFYSDESHINSKPANVKEKFVRVEYTQQYLETQERLM